MTIKADELDGIRTIAHRIADGLTEHRYSEESVRILAEACDNAAEFLVIYSTDFPVLSEEEHGVDSAVDAIDAFLEVLRTRIPSLPRACKFFFP